MEGAFTCSRWNKMEQAAPPPALAVVRMGSNGTVSYCATSSRRLPLLFRLLLPLLPALLQQCIMLLLCSSESSRLKHICDSPLQ
jgi:hypothetical protein